MCHRAIRVIIGAAVGLWACDTTSARTDATDGNVVADATGDTRAPADSATADETRPIADSSPPSDARLEVDTEPGDSTPPADTEPGDTAPPDTAPPDTAPPDTGPADTRPGDTATPSDTAPPADIAEAPRITRDPAPLTVLAGTPATLSVEFTANPSPRFHWRHDGVDVPGAGAATLTIPYALLSDAGRYDVVVTNDLGEAISAPALLTVEIPPGPPAVFTTMPIDLASLTDLEPLGDVNPTAHTLPTAHTYLYFNWAPGRVPLATPPVLPVYAPGSGTIIIVRTSSFPVGDTAIYVRSGPVFVYYLGHFLPADGVVLGAEVTAGQQIGTTNGVGAAIDFGAINEAAPLAGFVNPLRYSWETLYCDSPYRYFEEPLRSAIYARVRRTGADKDGSIDHDVPGTLAGNWFEEGLPIAETEIPPGWPKQLSIGPDCNDPSAVLVGIGGTVSDPGKYHVATDDPAPIDVTVASGKVVYHLLNLEGGTLFGRMIVQLVDDTHLRIEILRGEPAGADDFTTAALVYVR